MNKIEKRAHKNLAILNTWLTPASEPIGSLNAPLLYTDEKNHDEVIDFQHRGQRFYISDPHAIAAHQVRQYFEANLKFETNITVTLKDDAISYIFAKRVDQKLKTGLMLKPDQRDLKTEYVSPKSYAGLVVIWGLGLGYHIPHLMRHYKPIRVIIVESAPEILAASLAASKWDEWRAYALKHNIQIEVVYHTDPEQCALAVLNAVNCAPMSLLSFIRYFQHQKNLEMEAVVVNYKKVEGFLISGRGYFSDELRQVVASLRNVSKYPAINFARREIRPGSCALVIGSGPSLDHSFDLLKKLRPYGTLFSCGSVLPKLLKKGLMPDFQVELETHPINVLMYSDIAKEYSIENIPFFTSTGAPKDMFDNFNNVTLFVRAKSTTTDILEDRFPEICNTFPRVGNAGAGLAAHLGFESILLFGMDCGYPSTGVHHASETIYDHKVIVEIDEHTFQGQENLTQDMQRKLRSLDTIATIEVMNTIEETIASTADFVRSIQNYSELAMTPGLKVFQIGYGAWIQNAVNTTPDRFDASSINQESSFSFQMTAKAPKLAENQKWCLSKLDRMVVDSKKFKHRLEMILRYGFKSIRDFVVRDLEMTELVSDYATSDCKFGISTMSGTLSAMCKMILERAVLCRTQTELDAYFECCRVELIAAIDDMVKQVEHERDEFAKVMGTIE